MSLGGAYDDVVVGAMPMPNNMQHFRHRTVGRRNHGHHTNPNDDDDDDDDEVDIVDDDVTKGRQRQNQLAGGWSSGKHRYRRILIVVAMIIIVIIFVMPFASFFMMNPLQRKDGMETYGCTFRTYPTSRRYGLSSSQQQQSFVDVPDFLSHATYIRGQWPVILNPIKYDNTKRQTSPNKVCIHTSSWEHVVQKNGTGPSTISSSLPFTDGQNPSIVSLASEPYTHVFSPLTSSTTTIPSSLVPSPLALPRLDHRHLRPLLASIENRKLFSSTVSSLDQLFLGAIAFGSGQCRFGLVEEENERRREEMGPPGGKRAVIYVLVPTSNLHNNSTLTTTVISSTQMWKQNNNNANERQSSYSGGSFTFRTLAQSTLFLERDAKYGTSRNRALPPIRLLEEDESTSTPLYNNKNYHARIQLEFDDPRLFFHHGRIWILYRNGPLFGYDAQVHNPIHFEYQRNGTSDRDIDNEDGKFFIAYIKASETIIIRGGRNIALISEEPIISKRDGKARFLPFPPLKALLWVDPVTVLDDIDLRGVDKHLTLIDVDEGKIELDNNGGDLTGIESVKRRRRALLSKQQPHSAAAAKKSNIHGTNGYMIPLISTGELLGIAHFHRPEDRRPSHYALHGHHYTHAFFTIARDDVGTTSTTSDANTVSGGRNFTSKTEPQYKLRRLSNEFLFRTNSISHGMTQSPAAADDDDGDIIQFASGLDLLGSDIDGRAIISYGINDCEGAVFTLSMETIQKMLIAVRPGQEVADLMMELGK